MKTQKIEVCGLVALLGLACALTPGHAAQYVVAWGGNTYKQTDVPPGLTNVIAVAANSYSSLALRADGTIVAWGDNYYGLADGPQNLTNAMAISANTSRALALRKDGAVVAWGTKEVDPLPVPDGLTNVVAVAAGPSHSIALKANGTVTGWGGNSFGQISFPPDLTNAVCIAAGNATTMAIRADGDLWMTGQLATLPKMTNVAAIAAGDTHAVIVLSNGTVIAWGSGPTNAPRDLTNAVAVAAGFWHNLAIRADRTLAAWGNDSAAQSHIPPGLTNVLAVAAAGSHSLALVEVGDGSPVVVRHPHSVLTASGRPITFDAAAEGEPTPSCQWQRDGKDIPGATNLCLSILAPCSADSGAYRALFTNPHGIATSLEATLDVYDCAPSFYSEPKSQNAGAGTTATLAPTLYGSLPMAYQWFLNDAVLPNATGASLVISNVQPADAGCYRLAASNAWGAAISPNLCLNIVHLSDALSTAMSWGTYGDAVWFAEDQSSDYSILAARSGDITDSQSSTIQTEVAGPGTFIFQWKVSSEAAADVLSFSVNGAELKRISGEIPWRTETCYLGAGLQELTWRYAKDSKNSSGKDAAWLDWVNFKSGPTLPTITVQPRHQALTPGADVVLSVAAYGTPPLRYQWQLNGVNLPGATNDSLTLLNVGLANVGRYRAVVSNPYGTNLSSEGSLFTVAGPALQQDALDRWYLRSTAAVSRVRYVGNLFIGMGANGLLLTSPDGSNWTTRASGTTAALCGAAYGAGGLPWRPNRYVVVGSGGTILMSLDGVQWSPVLATSQDLNDVCGELSGFVATATATTASDANVFRCSDGTNWTGVKFVNNPDSGFPFFASSVARCGNYFVTAGGSQFAYGIWRSSNGRDWNYVGFSDQVVSGIASHGQVGLMIGYESWPRVSTDYGASWFASTSSVIWDPAHPFVMVGNDVAFGNGVFVVVGSLYQNGFLTTPDGMTWTRRHLFLDAGISSVAYGKGTFVVACAGGAYPTGIYQSENVARPAIRLGLQTAPKSTVLSISGAQGSNYQLFTSSNLWSWKIERSWTMTSSPVQFVLPFSEDSPRLFYKVTSP